MTGGQAILASLGNDAQPTQRWILNLQTDWHGICICPRVTTPHARHPPLTFKSMSRTHLSTRWLVQTTGSMFCVSQRARRSWRACGEREWVSWGFKGTCRDHTESEGPWCWQGPLHADVRGPGQIIHVSPFLLGNGEKPTSRGRATCMQSVGPGGTHCSCLVCIAQPPPA